MNSPSEKIQTPAYGSFKTLVSYMDETKENGHIPLRVDRSELPKLSGSAANELMATMKYFGLISSDKSEPTPLFGEFVHADNEQRKALFDRIVRSAYGFLINAPGIHIDRATGQQVSELFRGQGVSGSTLQRAMTLFLATAKAAGLKVSPSVRPPKVSTNGRVKKEKKAEATPAPTPPPREELLTAAGEHRFEIPIPGKKSVLVSIPEELDAADWEMLTQMFAIYVTRWKSYSKPRAPIPPPPPPRD